jgi:catechol 2,3-dioxygenase-like lactoylglutathione lyase family enzyme
MFPHDLAVRDNRHVADRMVNVVGLDHIVLTCEDVERSLAWYTECLGLRPERIEEWRRGEAPFPSVRVDAGTIIDLFPGPSDKGRLDHFCLVIEPTDLQALADSGRFEVRDGPARRFGARGDGTSLYIADPDGTTIELRHY